MKNASRLLRGPMSLAFRGLIMVFAVAAVSPASSGQVERNVQSPAETCEVASYLRSEVRLRKLHLVRPDLIQYPLVFDIVC